MQHVFVYGTLRAGEANDIGVAAARHGIAPPTLIGTASMRGRLFDFGDYPGPAVDPAAGSVVGDVYAIDDALVAVLDEIEEVYPGVEGLFLARETMIDVGATSVRCRFYPVARASVKGLPEIRGGDWVAYRQRR
jgi:gamma-glutamylcyclotransferase (GGCT)/AIG2-like uncharacterized protein YtfP